MNQEPGGSVPHGPSPHSIQCGGAENDAMGSAVLFTTLSFQHCHYTVIQLTPRVKPNNTAGQRYRTPPSLAFRNFTVIRLHSVNAWTGRRTILSLPYESHKCGPTLMLLTNQIVHSVIPRSSCCFQSRSPLSFSSSSSDYLVHMPRWQFDHTDLPSQRRHKSEVEYWDGRDREGKKWRQI